MLARALSAGWMLASREWLADVRQSRSSLVWPLVYPLAYTALLVLLRPALDDRAQAPARYAVFVLVGFSLWQTWIDTLRLQLGAIRRHRGLISRGELDSAALLATAVISGALQLAPRLLLLVVAAVTVLHAGPIPLIGLVTFSLVMLLNAAVLGALLQPFATLSPALDRIVQGVSLALLLTAGVFAPIPGSVGPALDVLATSNPMGILLEAARAPLFGESIARVPAVAAWSLATALGLGVCRMLGRRLLPIVTERLGN